MVIGKETIRGQSETVINKPEVMTDVKGREEDRLPAEVESWMEKVEKRGSGDVKQIKDEQGQIVMRKVGDDNDDDDKLKLPVSRSVFSNGFSLAVNNAGRWLSEFLFRLIKMKKMEVEFKKDNER